MEQQLERNENQKKAFSGSGCFERKALSPYEAVDTVVDTLRRCSDKMKPLTALQLRECCAFGMSEKKIKACLKSYMELQRAYKGDMFVYHNGGTMVECRDKNGACYYWEPLLTGEESCFLEQLEEKAGFRTKLSGQKRP